LYSGFLGFGLYPGMRVDRSPILGNFFGPDFGFGGLDLAAGGGLGRVLDSGLCTGTAGGAAGTGAPGFNAGLAGSTGADLSAAGSAGAGAAGLGATGFGATGLGTGGDAGETATGASLGGTDSSRPDESIDEAPPEYPLLPPPPLTLDPPPPLLFSTTPVSG